MSVVRSFKVEKYEYFGSFDNGTEGDVAVELEVRFDGTVDKTAAQVVFDNAVAELRVAVAEA